jgi:predicted RNA binding protein YcfA (HicA-like mRNA interferase family)
MRTAVKVKEMKHVFMSIGYELARTQGAHLTYQHKDTRENVTISGHRDPNNTELRTWLIEGVAKSPLAEHARNIQKINDYLQDPRVSFSPHLVANYYNNLMETRAKRERGRKGMKGYYANLVERPEGGVRADIVDYPDILVIGNDRADTIQLATEALNIHIAAEWDNGWGLRKSTIVGRVAGKDYVLLPLSTEIKVACYQ